MMVRNSILVLTLVLIASLSNSLYSGTAQLGLAKYEVKKEYKKADYISKYDSLLKEFGQNKILPKGYELQALIALSHFPELKEVKIKFVMKPAYIPLTSQPNLWTVLRKTDRREYLVIISSQSSPIMDNIILKSLSFNAQIGVIGHELAHTAFYINKSGEELASVALDYIFPNTRSQFEKDTDRRTIRHGLGWQLYEYAAYVRSLPEMEDDNEWIDQYYMSPKKILEYMALLPEYSLNQ
ncbi:MAG: hypothetical protein NVV82_03460 [Sporocytophaga sp.]|nr:hypothetical protein [Sporocytophaga sp.]